MKKHLVIGNWKMNPSSLDEAKNIAKKTRSLAAELGHTEVVMCPPLVYIAACVPRAEADAAKMGAQIASVHEEGAHTGEVSARMLRELGAEYAIVGHSEQREAGESDATVAAKVLRVLEAGMKPVLCVGEKTRDENGAYLEGLTEQIKKSLAGIPADHARDVIIAYEPVWAIGAAEAMAPEQVYETSLFVKKIFADMFGQEAAMKIKVLYGGSVNFRNAADIMSVGKVDGLLVGRESVNMPGFAELLKAVDAL